MFHTHLKKREVGGGIEKTGHFLYIYPLISIVAFVWVHVLALICLLWVGHTEQLSAKWGSEEEVMMQESLSISIKLGVVVHTCNPEERWRWR